MSSQYTLKFSAEQAREMPMVDLAFEVLKASKNPYYYRDLMQEIAKIKGLTDEQVMQVIAQLYTEINIDGRFACVGTNLWGLKRWYPVEKSEDAVGSAKHPRIINDLDDDEEDYYPEEEEAEEDYDSFEGNEEEDFYPDEEAVDDDAEIEEVEGEIEEIDEEAEEEEEFDGEEEEEESDFDEDEDADEK